MLWCHLGVSVPGGGGHSAENVYVPCEQCYAKWTLNAWIELLFSTPNRGNLNRFSTLNTWDFNLPVSELAYISPIITNLQTP